MRTVMQKGAARVLALFLCLTMLLGMVPASMAAGTEATDADTQSRIVHLDMGRKYFTPDWIKSLIDEMAKLGYNQLELDFGNSQEGQLRFALEDMSVDYTYTEQTMVPVDNTDAQEEPAAPVETGEPVEEQPAAPVQTEEPADEEQTAETVMPLQEEPAAPAETVAPTVPVTDEVLEQAEESETASGVIKYTYINEEKSDTIDLSAALPAPGEYITEAEMEDIIDYAGSKDIEIVPLLNSPGHFGAVLCAAPEFRYPGSTSSLDITNEAARNFGVAVVQKYAAWFAEQGCTTFNIGADEFANDSGMGFANLQPGEWANFDSYITALYNMLMDEGYTTVRMFNDGVNYGPDYGYKHTSNIPEDIQICYWSNGWDGYDVASASDLASARYSLINTNGDYYFVLKTQKDGSKLQVQTEESALNFSNDGFMGSTVSNSTGSMFCIWCDEPDNATQDEIMAAVKAPMTAVAYQMQGGEAGTHLTYEEFKQGAADSVTDEITGVTVSVNGLNKLEVVKQDRVETLEGNALYSDYVAYDIKLNNGSYTAQAQVTIPLNSALSGAENLVGFVMEDNQVVECKGTRTGNSFTFTAPHFSVVGVAAKNADAVTVRVPVGGTVTKTVDGKVTVTQEPNAEVANVEVTYNSASEKHLEEVSTIESGQQYIIENVRAGKVLTDQSNKTVDNLIGKDVYGLKLEGSADPASQELWTISSSGNSFTIQRADSGKYLRVGDGRDTNGKASVSDDSQSLTLTYMNGTWTIAQAYRYETWTGDWRTQTYYLNDYSGKGNAAGGWNDSGAYNDAGSKWKIYKVVDGVSQDTTTVTFTGVSAGETTAVVGSTVYTIEVYEDLDVEPLEVEYWITNAIAKDGSGATGKEIPAALVNSEAGMAVTELVPEVAYKQDNNRELVFWKVRILPYGNHQLVLKEDMSEGDRGWDVNYIRYQSGKWQASADGSDWTEISSTDQIVAYYMFKSDVTEEVTTAVKDWGITSGGDWGYNPEQYRSVITYQLVLEDGTEVPVSGSDAFINVNSMIFHNVTPGGRVMGSFMVLQDGSYDVAKITATNGDVKINTRGNIVSISSLNYPGVGTDAEVTLWEGSSTDARLFVDTTALEGEAADAVRFTQYSDDAILIRIYVKPKAVSANLQVQYLEDGHSSPFHTVSYVATSPENFSNGFVNSDGMLIMGENGQSTAAIESTTGRTQYVNSRLEELPTIPPQYKYLDYKLVRAEVDSQDPTILKLYYTIAAAEYTFVADYGLPMVITAEQFGIPEEAVNSVAIQGSGMGELKVNGKQLVYQMNSMSPSTRRFSVAVTFNGYQADDGTRVDGGTATYSFEVIPASTVYYEAETPNLVNYSGAWNNNGTSSGGYQQTEKLGESTNYGSDVHYNNVNLTSSNGAAMKVDVSSIDGGAWPTATFTFTGTGADIISQTDSSSTWLLVEVKDTQNALKERAYLVNNHYSAVNEGVNEIYQVPVIKITGLPYGTYTVTVKPFYDTNEKQLLAVSGQKEFKFYLDAIRVYNPLGSSGDAYYTKDNEAKAQFINLSKCKLESTGLWVDSNPNAEVNAYKNIGPNNEIYLAVGQSVTITLPEDVNVSGMSAQIGARLIDRTSGGKISVGSQSIDVNSTVDQYYTVGIVEKTITIKNSGSGIVALTTLKLTGSN